MIKLNLPEYEHKFEKRNNIVYMFDFIRKKYIKVTPEEWVRQNFILYLINEKSFPASLLAIEKKIILNTLTKRCDIVAYSKNGNPLLIVECKAPTVEIKQTTFDQIARYNMKLKVRYLIVTNGLKHFCCFIDYEKANYSFIDEIPSYNKLVL